MNERERSKSWRWSAVAVVAVFAFVGSTSLGFIGLATTAVVTQCPLLAQGNRTAPQPSTQTQLQSQSGQPSQAGNVCKVVEWARQGGFTGQAMYNAAAIALAESSGNSDPKSSFTPDKNGGTYGLMQLNLEEWNTWGAKYGDIGDPVAQMKASFDYSHGGRDFDPWCTSIASMNASGKNGCNGAGGATAGKFLAAVESCKAGQGGGMGATSEQTQNAQAIIAEVQKEGLPQQAALDAVETALAESDLRNLQTAVDHDSLGLFQQRPSQGWGSPQQVTNPQYATSKFLEALKGLPFVSMSPEEASQAVQKSGAPQRYAQFRDQAQQLVNQLWNGAQSPAQPQTQGSPQAPATAGFCPQLQGRPNPQTSGNPEQKPSTLPLPIPAGALPAPGWKETIPVPSWPSGLPGTRVNPSAITPQCVAGALWAWAAVHIADAKFAHPPPMNVESAYQMTSTAQSEGFRMDASPQVGDMVVFRNGSFYGPNGHVGLVAAIANDHYLVVEQNFTNTVEDLGNHWGTWDIRSIGWPDQQASGFIAAPPGG